MPAATPPARAWLATCGILAASAAAAALAAKVQLQLLPSSDPFHDTLLILPVLLAAFAQIAAWSARLGGRRLGRRGTAIELAALALLLLLVFARPRLGLAAAAEVVAAGFLLLLAHRLARQLLALRPLLGRRLPRRPASLFFLLPLTAYLAILPWSAAHRQPDGDEPYNLLITHSLAYDGDADLTNNYAASDWRHFMDHPIAPQPGDPVGPHGEIYSRHNLLLPLFLAPAYRLAGKTGALATMAALAAALAWMTLRLGRHYAPQRPGEKLAAYALVAFASPLPLYSYQVWVEVPAALLAMIALDRILDLDRTAAAGSWRISEWLGIGATILLLPLVKIRFVLIAAPLFGLACWRAGARRRPLLVLGLLLAGVAAGILIHNQLLFANPLKIHSLQEVDPQSHSPLDYLTGLLGLFFDAAFGLFGCSPIWLLLLPAALLLAAERHPLPLHLALLALPYLLIVTPRLEWYGGWSPPFRYALIALPLFGLALAPLLARRRRPGARALLAGLGALTCVLTLVWITVPGWTYNFADGRTHLLDLVSSRLGADVARFFPSSVRPRAATWIWPPLALVLVPAIWWLPARRRARGGLAGVAALLGAAAALPLAAARVPTRVIELEDPQVIKSGGHLYPDLWVIERTRYRGGWVLRVGESLRAPVNAGGRQVRLSFEVQFIRNQPVPFTLDLAAGGRHLASWTPRRERVWEELNLGPFAWPAGAPLVVSARGPHPPGALNGAILDRVELRWQAW